MESILMISPLIKVPISRNRINRVLGRAMKWVSEGNIDEILCFFLEYYPLRPETILKAYSWGFFPMANEKGRYFWHHPAKRAVLPIDDFKVEKNTKRAVRRGDFTVTMNTAFRQVVEHCATTANRQDWAWITPKIMDIYQQLHQRGVAHSIEVWQDDELVGGSYGIALGSYYNTESQFHLASNAGKVGEYYLYQSLKESGFLLHDIQYLNTHAVNQGGYTLPRDEFKRQLVWAMAKPAELTLTETIP